jgi:uroporphyrinogen decarboxylase
MPANSAKTNRVLAALNGEPVDRVPVSAWWHDFAREWSARDLAEATLEAYREYDWDFIKVNPRFCYYAEPWGAEYTRFPDKMPEPKTPAVASAADLARVKPVDGTAGAFAEQLESLELIAAGLAGEAPYIQTVFSPLATMSRMTGDTAVVQGLMRDAPEALDAALGAVSETLAQYAEACLEAGASGIFYAGVEWGSLEFISGEDYDRFGRPHDERILEAVEGAPFNVLHVCRNHNHLPRLLDYAVAAFHWDARGEGNPSIRDIMSLTDRAVIGGVDHKRTMRRGGPADVGTEAAEALAESGGRRFLLAPNCAVDPTSPEENLLALVEAVLTGPPRAQPDRAGAAFRRDDRRLRRRAPRPPAPRRRAPGERAPRGPCHCGHHL